jgi:hypothetical protein
MEKRLNLQADLETLLGSENVYFQPPESLKLHYPCIKYKQDKLEARYANNKKYSHLTRYQVTTIERDPDGQLSQAVFDLPLCSHERRFVADGLTHDIFSLYY